MNPSCLKRRSGDVEDTSDIIGCVAGGGFCVRRYSSVAIEICSVLHLRSDLTASRAEVVLQGSLS